MTIWRRHMIRLLTAAPFVAAARISRARGVEWSMATEYPATSMSDDGLRFFAEALARESGGRLTVKSSFEAAG